MYGILVFQLTKKKESNPKCIQNVLHFQRSQNSKYHKITEWLGLKENSGGHLVTVPAKAQSPEAGLHPGRF